MYGLKPVPFLRLAVAARLKACPFKAAYALASTPPETFSFSISRA